MYQCYDVDFMEVVIIVVISDILYTLVNWFKASASSRYFSFPHLSLLYVSMLNTDGVFGSMEVYEGICCMSFSMIHLLWLTSLYESQTITV